MGIPVDVNGSWKDGKPYVNVNGSWKEVQYAYANVNGSWEEVFANYNNATGGSISTFSSGGKTFRVHTFTSSSTLNVTTAPHSFTVGVVGGGYHGGIGDYAQYGGGGGGVKSGTINMSVGSHAITVGGQGGTTKIASYFSVAGAGGGNGSPGPGGGRGGPNGGGGGSGASFNITGGSIQFSGGGGSVNWNYCCPATGGNGGKRGGGNWYCNGQNPSWYGAGGGRVQHTCSSGHGRGYPGIAYVVYQIGGPL